MKFFCIEIDKKTDILALAAFLLSLGMIMTNIILMIRGPNINVIKPEQITILSYESTANNKKYLKFYTDIYFFNSATPGYDDVVRKVYASMIIGSKKINFQWQYFSITDFNDKNEIIENRKPAEPILIKARQSGGAETHFYPFVEQRGTNFDNFVPWNKFIQIIKIKKNKPISITFNYETFSGKNGEVNCNVMVTDNFLKGIERNDRANLPCF